MKRFVETLEFELNKNPNLHINLQNMIIQWSDIEYAELSIILVYLRHLYFLHQTNHWISKGDNYYGDHLLFQRLYEDIQSEIDLVAEKAVGLGNEKNVNLTLQTAQLFKLIKNNGSKNNLLQQNNLAQNSLEAEKNFLHVVNELTQILKDKNNLTRGVDNMLAAIEDKHEEHVYLLKQRCASNNGF